MAQEVIIPIKTAPAPCAVCLRLGGKHFVDLELHGYVCDSCVRFVRWADGFLQKVPGLRRPTPGTLLNA
jgi:hypothetical protein